VDDETEMGESTDKVEVKEEGRGESEQKRLT